MTARTFLNTILILLAAVVFTQAQEVENEVGFKYVKGNYLFDSGRFDEAIQIYNDILKGEPSYEDALIYRARAKYALGANKGAKKDALAYISYNGLNEDVCLIMGKAELGIGNALVAISYLDYAIMKNADNAEALLFRGNAYFEIEDDVKACTDWHKALLRGSDRARQQADSYCQRVAIPIEDKPKEEVIEVTDNEDDVLDDGEVLSTGSLEEETMDEDEITGEVSNDDDSPMKQEEVIMVGENGPITNPDEGEEEVISTGTMLEDEEDEEDEPEVVEVKVEPVDQSIEILEIDEDLDIKVYAGIGNRRLKNVPDILILSDNAGQVVVDICVDKSGNVKSATLNRDDSTIGSAGLISLSLRKAREFKFDRSRKSEQCGKIAFMIK